MNSTRRLLVTGATGKQGGALIESLLSRPSGNPFQIYALTRNTTSRSAQALASKPNVSLVQGDLDDCPTIFKKIEKPWGVYSVTPPIKGAEVEEKQGKALADAAVAAGVKQSIFTATDRGGDLKSEGNPTPVAHFASKYRVEEHIKEV
ncbi:hypothetical protein LTR16_005672, partial [Cryomyces antarcticus]